jgi:NAD(P)-dependent dehydrogenase (short-subunit alcohol dehydrogenase family)
MVVRESSYTMCLTSDVFSQTALITRANTGFGFKSTCQLLALPALVLVPILRAKRGTKTPAHLSLVGSDTSYYANWKGTESESAVEVLDNQTHFDSWEAYKTTKLLLLMFAYKLSQRVSSDKFIINVSILAHAGVLSLGQWDAP